MAFLRAAPRSPLGTTNYLYDGANLIEEVGNGGTAVGSYTHGGQMDEPLAELRSGNTSFYAADALGSITSLISTGGLLANTYTYDAFGKLTASTGTATNPFQYTGRDYDPETSLRYYRARYYDQNLGRFVNEDPSTYFGGIRVGQPWTLNSYVYVSSSPINYRDPMGLEQSGGTRSGDGGPSSQSWGEIQYGRLRNWIVDVTGSPTGKCFYWDRCCVDSCRKDCALQLGRCDQTSMVLGLFFDATDRYRRCSESYVGCLAFCSNRSNHWSYGAPIGTIVISK